MIKLSKRMQAIVSLASDQTDTGGTICEIGCDHGKILGSIVNRASCTSCTNCTKAIFVDKRPLCLEKSKQLMQHISSNTPISCEFYLSDGFTQIPTQKIHTTIIAGMGGHMIAEIISQEKAAMCNHFVLQPNKNVLYLREQIEKLGFQIIAETTIEEKGKIYPILKIRRTQNERRN